MAVGAAAYNHLHKDETSGLLHATRCFVEAVQGATKSFSSMEGLKSAGMECPKCMAFCCALCFYSY